MMLPGWDRSRLPPWARSPSAAYEWWTGAARATLRGEAFPRRSRRALRPAPGGTTEDLPDWGPLKRMLREQSAFSTSVHRLPLPGLKSSLRLLHLSDVHLRGPGAWLDKLCHQMQGLRPDLVLLTGDMVTGEWDGSVGSQFLQALPQATLGRFYVTGNWERILGPVPPDWTRLLESQGIASLDNQRVDIGPVLLAGVEDLLAGDARLEAVLDEPTEKPLVLLAHTPTTIDRVVEQELWRQRVGLMLSGHTHAGQVRIPWIGAPWLPSGTGPYIGGWYEVGGVPLFVSRGVGWSLLPLRMWCPPELAMIELIPAEPGR